MAYKIRFILDVTENVVRDIAIDKECTLEDLHHAATKAFGFGGHEMASYYRSDNEWNQGEEIPLFDMSDAGVSICMQNCTIAEILKNKNDKLIYVYDFMNLWTFFVELVDLSFTSEEIPAIVASLGNIPETAPEKKFEAEINLDEFGDVDAFENQDLFDNIDDYDF